jgi:peroxiredoxin
MHRFLTLAAAALIALPALAEDFRLGGKVSNFALQNTQGGSADFNSLKGDLTVVAFISTQCPISNDYNERMIALQNDYGKKARFIFVNSNSTESAETVAAHAKQAGFNFPVYKDAGNAVADRFGAQVTPEMFVIDKSGTIVYHGFIDDARNPARVTTQGLRLALDAVLAGKPVAAAETKAFGCTIKRMKKVS